MESMENRDLAKAESKNPSTISTGSKSPSGSAADQQFPVTYRAIISCRLGDVDRIRSDIEKEGGRIIFQTTSEDNLFLFRERQVERILNGDTSALAEVHRRKQRRVEI